jgi:predicted transcriptional regulator
MAKQNRNVISFVVDDELLRAIERQAEKTDRKKSDAIRQILKKELLTKRQ